MENNQQIKQHKIIVGGIGRTGSTALMCILSYLELGTGFGKYSYKNEYINKIFFLEGRTEAYIFKENENANLDPERFDKYIIDCFVWLQRDIKGAADSRIKKHENGYWMGGLTADTEWHPEKQRKILWNKHQALEAYLKENRIPFVDIKYPKFTRDFNYLYEKLLIPFPELEKDSLKEAFNLIIKPELVSK